MTLGCSKEESKPLVIPREYQHAKEMLDRLYNEGFNIQEIHNPRRRKLF